MKAVLTLGLSGHHRRTVSAIVAGLVSVICLLASPYARSEPPRALIVGSEIGFTPYAAVDSNGHAVGFSVELFSAVARVMDIPIQYRVSDWDDAWNGLLKGELDALPVVARFKEREGLVEYTSTHTIAYDCFFVRKGAPHLASIDAARGRRIIVMRSDAAQHALAGRGFKSELVLTDTIPDALRMLAAGQNDGVLAPMVTGNNILREHDLSNLEAGPPLKEYQREFAFAVQKGNTALRDKLEQGLIIVKASGEYQRIYNHWLGIYEPAPFPVKYLAWGGGGVSVVLLLFGLWNLTLRRSRDRLRKSEAALQKSNAMLHSVIENVSARVFWKDRESRYLGCNTLFAHDSGHSGPDELIGKTDFDMGWKDRAELYISDDKAVMESGIPRLEYEEVQTMPIGSTIRVCTSKVPLLDANGQISGILGFYQDISERKRTESELSEQLEELQRWYVITSGREQRILELKHEVNELLGSSRQPPRYASAESQNQEEDKL